MLTTIFHALIILLPVIVFFSGMAMTPVLILLTLIILASVPSARQMRLRSWRNPPVAAVFLVLVWFFLSVSWSIAPEHSFTSALRVSSIVFLGVLACLSVSRMPELSSRGLRLMAYAAVFVSLLMLSELLPSGGLIYHAYHLANANYERFIDKNVNRGLCALSVFIWIIVAGLYRVGEKRLRWVVSGLLAGALFSSGSQSAQLGLLSGAIAFLMIQRWPNFSARALTVVLPLFLLSFTTLFSVLEKPFFDAPEVKQMLPDSDAHRVHIWRELIESASQRPWFGWGLDATRAVPFPEDMSVPDGMRTPPLHPHSTALQIQLELGWVGLILCVSALFLVLRAWRSSYQHRGIDLAFSGAIITSYFVTGLSSFGIWQTWWMATLFIALALYRFISVRKPNSA